MSCKDNVELLNGGYFEDEEDLADVVVYFKNKHYADFNSVVSVGLIREFLRVQILNGEAIFYPVDTIDSFVIKERV